MVYEIFPLLATKDVHSLVKYGNYILTIIFLSYLNYNQTVKIKYLLKAGTALNTFISIKQKSYTYGRLRFCRGKKSVTWSYIEEA